MISDDGGKQWIDGGPLGLEINTRAIEFFLADGAVKPGAGCEG